MLLNAFAAVALLLASIGLYGVISYFVGRRRQELGIRMALGASRSDVMRLVLMDGLKMASAGVVLGLTGAFALIALLLIAVALLACLVPAMRATRVDPMTALRHE